MHSRLTSLAPWLGLALALFPACLPDEYERPESGDAGGKLGSGGASSTGGASGSGGAKSTGGATSAGGALSTGGAAATGGGVSSGGMASSGGASASGGTSSGGSRSSGGSKATGGSNGTGGRASSGGASGSGGQQGSGGSATGCGSDQLCEDFESTNVDQLPQGWERNAGAGTIGVVTGTVHGGSKSLRVVSPSGSYETYMVNRSIFDRMPKNGLYGRIFMRINDRRHSTEAEKILHWTLVEGRGSNSNNRVRYGGIENGNTSTHKWLFNVETQQGDPHEASIDDDGADIQQDRWYCVEWMFDGTSDANEARLWTDGTEHQKIHATQSNFFNQENGKYEMPDFNALFIGWAIYQASDGPYEIFLDDLKLGPNKLGCN